MATETFCPYGGTGSGKTTQAAELAIEVHRRTGKKTRLASWSREGWKEIKPAIDLGIVVPCYFPTRKLAIQVAQQVCKGRWPEHVEDTESPMVTPKNQPDRADVGALVIDSGTEMAQFLFSYSLGREANEDGFKVSAEDPSHIYRDGDTPFAAGGRAHYGAIQARIVENVRWTKELPLYVMWTWLETKGKDTSKGKEGPAIYVPDVIGDAINSYVPSWFDNTVHLVLHGYGDVLVHRMYLKTHTGDDNIPCPAKCRPPLGGELPSYLEGKQASIARLMQLLDAAEEQGMKVMRDRLGWEEGRVFQSRASNSDVPLGLPRDGGETSQGVNNLAQPDTTTVRGAIQSRALSTGPQSAEGLAAPLKSERSGSTSEKPDILDAQGAISIHNDSGETNGQINDRGKSGPILSGSGPEDSSDRI